MNALRRNRLGLLIAVAILAGALAVAGVGTAFAWGPFNGSPNRSTGFGPGNMMGGSYGYGPGMMGGWSGQGSASQGQQITLDQAASSFQAYLEQTGDKDLALDEVMEFQDNFYAIVKEKSAGTDAFELLANKYTGVVTPEIGPNMMWNTKYGMHSNGFGGYGSGSMGPGMMGGFAGGMMGGRYGSTGGQYGPTSATGPMTVSADEAQATAQKWLDQNQAGATTEQPDTFHGYYTLHILRDGKVTGMLSVNGYTGQVWYHSWHGQFIQMKEMGD